MDVENLAKELILKNMTPEQQMAVLDSVRSSVAQAKEVQKRKIGENVDLVVQALKKIESDIRSRFDDVGNSIEKRVASIKDGRDGINGKDGRDGKDGRSGKDGAKGDKGDAGRDGRDGVDGVDGVSVTAARIDFDGSLVITLSSGVELNVGEVVAPDLAERIKVITNGGGTSQSVLDTLASLQTQIDNLIPSQTGNSGKFLTTNGSALSWASVAGGLNYQGTWNASTNSPTLTSSVGTNGYYYVVGTAGSTNLNGITDWVAGDWLIFNGSTWQKIDQSWAIAGANDNITSMTGITGGISSPDFIQFDTAASVTNAVGKLYWDSTQATLTVGLTADIAADVGQTLYAYVTNAESVTINKGQPVYMFGAQGDRMTVKLAYNTGDATSAKTVGVCAEDIAAGQTGLILCQGVQDGLNLGSYTAGDTLYLGATAGTLTATKPYAPNHLVYIGVVERANNGNGRLYVRVQNGYEMDELHNVSAQNPTNGQVLIYNESTSLWEKHTLTDGTGISITEGAGSITIANSAPDQTVSLTGAGTTSISGTYPNFTVTSNDAYVGTVTSVGGTGTVNGISLSGTVTSSGNLTLGGALTGVDLTTQVTGTLPVANGGTGATTLTANNVLLGNGTSSPQFVAPGTTGNVLTSDGTTWTSAPSSGGGFPSGTAMMFVQTSAPTGWTKSTTHDNKALRVVSGTASSGGTVAFTTAFASKSVSGSVSSTTATNQAQTATNIAATPSGTVNGTTLGTSEMPSHNHLMFQNTTVTAGTGGTSNVGAGNSVAYATTGASDFAYVTRAGSSSANVGITASTGGGGSHNHSFSGNSFNLSQNSHNHTQDAHSHTFSGTAIDLAVQYVDVIIATKD